MTLVIEPSVTAQLTDFLKKMEQNKEIRLRKISV